MVAKLPDYKQYHFSKIEWLTHSVVGFIYFFVISMLFFNHIPLSLVATGGTYFYIREKHHESVRRQKILLGEQFREGMYALGSALSAGRSMELAFYQSYEDLKILFKEEDMIVLEWGEIIRKLKMNETVEQALMDFAERSDMEDIQNFASIFSMAKRTGGNLVQITREAMNTLNEKMSIQSEINILVTQKRYEQKILSFILPTMICFFLMTSPEFLAPLYNSSAGRMIMLIAMSMYFFSSHIGRRIVEIEV